MAVEALMEDRAQKARRRKLVISILIVVVLFHVGAGVVAGIFVVARYFTVPPAQFVVQKDIRLPAKEREHKMNMAEFDANTPKPTFNDKLQSMRPSAFALPDLPKLPLDQMLPLDPSAMVSDAVSSMVGTAGMGSGGQGTGGLEGNGTGFTFFGIQSNAKRILLLFDVSGSVVNKAIKAGIPLTKIKEETLNTINALTPNSRFGMIQFTQNYKPFQEELVPATDQNKAAAKTWVDQEWVESGSMGAKGSKVVSNPRGFMGVLERAVEMQPDVIFVISDASFQWKPDGPITDVPWDKLRDLATGPLQGPNGCTIHLIGFEMKPEDRREASMLVRRTKGKVRELK